MHAGMNGVLGHPVDDEEEFEGEEVVEESGPIDLDDLLADPVDEEDEESGEELEVEEAPAAAGEIVVEPPHQREDGKWVHGKYVTDSLEELVVQVEKGRLNAEKLVGQRQQSVETNAFAYPGFEDEGDEFEAEVDDVDYLGQAIASALQSAGVAQPQQQVQVPGTDPMLAQQAVSVANQVVQTAIGATVETDLPTDEHFDQAVELVVGSAGNHPSAPATLRQLLDTWGSVNPHKAALKEYELRDRAKEQQAALQRQEAEQMFERELEQETQTQAAFRNAQEAFVTQRPDWVQRAAAMDAYMASNPALMQAAQGNEHAVYAVFETAYQIAGAGLGGVVSEHGGNMTHVNADPATLAATHSARAATQRDLGGMETVLGDPGLGISVANPNPPGLADTPLADLLGIPTLND